MTRHATEPGDERHGWGNLCGALPQHQHDVLENLVDEVWCSQTAGEIATHPWGIAGIKDIERLRFLRHHSIETLPLVVEPCDGMATCFRG
jgi:hypothetical protein